MPSVLTSPNLSQKNARQVMAAGGLRFTKQRALILEIIRQGRGHLDADEIYRRTRKKEPHLSLATVYRSLRRFKQLGLVDELHFNESHHHYEAKPSSEHHHLVCLGCGRVIEFRYPLSHDITANVAQAKDFKVVEAEVRLTGYCPKCRENQK